MDAVMSRTERTEYQLLLTKVWIQAETSKLGK